MIREYTSRNALAKPPANQARPHRIPSGGIRTVARMRSPAAIRSAGEQRPRLAKFLLLPDAAQHAAALPCRDVADSTALRALDRLPQFGLHTSLRHGPRFAPPLPDHA